MTSIMEMHLKNHYTSQYIDLNSDKNFFLQHMLPVIASELDFCTNKPDTITLLKVLVITIPANRKKKSPPQNKLIQLN